MADKKDYYGGGGPKPTKWQSLCTFVYNSETKQIMGRTGLSWAKITIFYLIFYTCLCAFFAAMLWVFYQTLDYKIPRWQLDSSIIGTNPGVGFRPMPPATSVESTLIWFRHGHAGNWQHWVNELNVFLKDYEHPSKEGGEHFQTCSFNSPPQEGVACEFDINDFQNECSKSDTYGYEKGRPCVFLKLNKIYGWEPAYYNDTEELPLEMPRLLQDYIRERKSTGVSQSMMNVVWVSCEGENPADVENLGPVMYLPMQGFPGYYFPYKNVPGYLSPLVAVQFGKPRNGVLINIECKAWAKNIIHNRQERRGGVHFELMVD